MVYSRTIISFSMYMFQHVSTPANATLRYYHCRPRPVVAPIARTQYLPRFSSPGSPIPFSHEDIRSQKRYMLHFTKFAGNRFARARAALQRTYLPGKQDRGKPSATSDRTVSSNAFRFVCSVLRVTERPGRGVVTRYEPRVVRLQYHKS